MKTIGDLYLKRCRPSLLAFNGSEIGSTASAVAPARAMTTAAQAFGHGVLTHAASRKRLAMPKDQVWRIEPQDIPASIRVLSGALWITQDGDQRDHVIQSTSRLGGQKFSFSPHAGATISALVDSELEVA